jgi:hypothetical protein
VTRLDLLCFELEREKEESDGGAARANGVCKKVESFGLFHESSFVKELSLLVAALVSDRKSGSKSQPDNCQRKKFVVIVVSGWMTTLTGFATGTRD